MSEVIIQTKEQIREFKDVVRLQYSNTWNSITITQEIYGDKVNTVVDDVKFIISQV
tara:strand:- start:678 stop:845 length:168 start_codon:yes stop_codon:yes gene_type:complete